MSEAPNEKKLGIKTAAIKTSTSKEFFHYQGASYLVLLKILPEIRELTGNVPFVDIGCGKGRAVIMAEYLGYDKLTGIELDAELIQEAKENLKTYRLKREESKIDFIHVNALEFEYRNEPTVYFLFNPFNEEVMEKVLSTILASSKSQTWFVYMNPMYTKPFEKRNIKIVKEFKTRFYKEGILFKAQ